MYRQKMNFSICDYMVNFPNYNHINYLLNSKIARQLYTSSLSRHTSLQQKISSLRKLGCTVIINNNYRATYITDAIILCTPLVEHLG